MDTETLQRVASIARGAGARVVVDEVYLDALSIVRRPRRSTSTRMLRVTSSLTKAYGLSCLRCGWVLRTPSCRGGCGGSTIFRRGARASGGEVERDSA